MLPVLRRRIVLAALGLVVGVLLLAGGYRFGPAESGGVPALVAGLAVVLGWCALLLTVFMVLVPALLPHR